MNVIPIAVANVHETDVVGFESALINVLQKLDALEGQIGVPLFIVAKEIQTPFNFVHQQWLQDNFDCLLSHGEELLVRVKAVHNFAEIYFDVEIADLMATATPRAQIEPSPYECYCPNHCRLHPNPLQLPLLEYLPSPPLIVDEGHAVPSGMKDYKFPTTIVLEDDDEMSSPFGGHHEGVQRNELGIVERKRSVLQDWVMKLNLREQGTLLTCIRGCDLVPKFPLARIERTLTAFIRGVVMVAYDIREVDSTAGCFMQTQIPKNWSYSALGHYPHHWVMHLVHALQIIALYHPNKETKYLANEAYSKMVHGMHLNPETPAQLVVRLTEDRVATGTIVE